MASDYLSPNAGKHMRATSVGSAEMFNGEVLRSSSKGKRLSLTHALQPPRLKPSDTILLTKDLGQGTWLCELNGTAVRLTITPALESDPSVVLEDDAYDEDPSIPAPPPPPELIKKVRRNSKRKAQSKKSSRSLNIPHHSHPKHLDTITREFLSQDSLQIREDLTIARMELQLIIKAYHQDFLKPGEDKNLPPELKLTSSPDSRVFEKMLETPYVPTVKEEVNTPNLTGVVETIGAEAAIEKATSTLIGVVEVALAPPGVLFIRDLLTPTFNLNACKKEDLDLLASLDLDIFPYHDDDNRETPILLVMHMFHQLKLIETFKIDEICLYRFLRTISSKYRQVPFHNWFHAFNVTQTMYHFLVECQAKNYLGPLEILALLVSTLCHDADHPGLNNSFQAKALTKIATLHKKSTLENHHLLHGYYALSFPECNILADLNAKDRDSFTRYMRDLILSTDLALHGIILRNMKERKKYIAKQNSGKNLSVELDYEDTIILMCCLIKCADLSNEIRPRNTAVKWAKMVMDEFIKQSKTEAKMDLAVTTFMDPSKIIIAKEQINFITNLCMPLYQNLQSVVPNLSIAIKQMNTNLADWQHRLSSWYTAEQAAQAANKSIWERNQIQDKKQKLSEFLGKQASS